MGDCHLIVEPRSEPGVLGHHQALGAGAAHIAALHRRPVIMVQVLDHGTRLIHEPQPVLSQPPREIEVFIVEHELGIEPS